ATQIVKVINQGKGVVLLSDMGSLNMFGEVIMNKTNIPTKTIKMVTTPMVIEATRKAMLPEMTIERLEQDIVEQSSFIGNSVQDTEEQATAIEGSSSVEDYRNKIICILEESLIFLDGPMIYDLLEE